MKSLKVDNNQHLYSKFNYDGITNQLATSFNQNAQDQGEDENQDINLRNRFQDESPLNILSQSVHNDSNGNIDNGSNRPTTTTTTTNLQNNNRRVSLSPSSSSSSTSLSNSLSDQEDSDEENTYLYTSRNKFISLKKSNKLKSVNTDSPTPIKHQHNKDLTIFDKVIEKWENVNKNINEIGTPSMSSININNNSIPKLPLNNINNHSSTSLISKSPSKSNNIKPSSPSSSSSSSTTYSFPPQTPNATNRFILLIIRLLVFPFLFVASIPFIFSICSFIVILSIFSFGTISVFLFLLLIAPFFVIGIIGIYYLISFLITGTVSNVHKPIINMFVNIYEYIMEAITYVIASALLKLKILFDKNNNSKTVSNNDKQHHYHQPKNF